MLTTFSWVPHGGMKTAPLRTSESADQVRSKLKEMSPTEGNEADGDDDVAVPIEEDPNSNDMYHCFGGGLLDQVESEDEDEVDDTYFRQSDLVFFTAGAREEEPLLELYVYDEPKDNLYVHHDAAVAAYPLCSAWLSDGQLSMAALGTMLPFIEIWPLDVMDAVEPACVLGGCVNAADNYKRRKIKKSSLKPESHADAVLCLEWNLKAQHLLASCSADNSIKLWDLNTQTCCSTFQQEVKIQSLQWHSDEAHLLLSGSFGGCLSIRDCRAPDGEVAVLWNVPQNDVVEHVEWIGNTSNVLASTSGGMVLCYDSRMCPSQQGCATMDGNGGSGGLLWSFQPHDADTTFNVSMRIPGLLATGGKDAYLSLWDVRACGGGGVIPELICTRKYRTGSVLCIRFHPNVPHVLGACGMSGEPLIYTMSGDIDPFFGGQAKQSVTV